MTMTPTTTTPGETQVYLSSNGANGCCNCDGGGGGPSVIIDFDHSHYAPSLQQLSSSSSFSSSLEMARHTPATTTTNFYQYPAFLPVYSKATPPPAVTPTPSPPVTSQFQSQGYPSYYSHVVSRESGQLQAMVPPPAGTRIAQSPSPSTVTIPNFSAIPPPQLCYSQTTLTSYAPLNTSMTKWNLNIESAGNGHPLGSMKYPSAMTRSPVSGVEPIPPPPSVPVEAQFLERSPPLSESPKEVIELVLASQHFDLQPNSLAVAETRSCSNASVVTSEKDQEGDASNALSGTPSEPQASTSATQKPKRRRKRVKSKRKETRKRMVWTEPLRERFLKALDQLGTFTAMPKDILKLMNVPGLTRENISSHLQKYRIKLEKEQATRHANTNGFERNPPPTREDPLGELQFEGPSACYAAALAAPGTAVLTVDSFTAENDALSSLLAYHPPSPSPSSSTPQLLPSPLFTTLP